MTRTINYKMEYAQNGCTILNFLKNKGYSKSILTHLKKSATGIQKNHQHAPVRATLLQGDILTVTLEEECVSSILPVSLPLSIIYEDDDILVLDKAAGMPSHPSMGHHEHTLGNGVAAYFHDKGDSSFVYRCINRLDRDTSGLTIIAKHMLSACILGNAVKNREIKREYLAIADGLTARQDTICAPIARKEESVIERMVDFVNGDTAITHYKRLKYENGLSLVSLNLETGRTHQIRVHMRHIGHPLIGDFLYHPNNHQMSRQALHARYLSFRHPITLLPMEFEAPVPSDFILTP